MKRREMAMHQGRIVFSQLLDFLPKKGFRTCVKRYKGNYRIRSFTCYEQFLCLAFAELTYRESLRDTVLCLRAMQGKLHHVGIQTEIAKSTLADANEKRDWRVYISADGKWNCSLNGSSSIFV
jgi:hypothetical protein